MNNSMFEKKINLCCGSTNVDGWINIDCVPSADIAINLECDLLPFADNSIDAVVCMSAINYFTFERGLEIVADVFRVLRPGGIARFGTQDLRVLVQHYLDNNTGYWKQRLPQGSQRFPGATLGAKLNAYWTGFEAGGHPCKVVYDYETLERIFRNAGFEEVQQLPFKTSSVADLAGLDNRPEQMFFLEAVKWPELAAFDVETSVRAFADLLAQGKKDQAWQHLLEVLRLYPHDRENFSRMLHVCVENQFFADAVKLVDIYTRASGDTQFCDLREKFTAKEAELRAPQLTSEERNFYAGRLNTVQPDEVHLGACLDWLKQAQAHTPDGGFAALYYPETRHWDMSYPETTGYILNTFLVYGAQKNNAELTALAEKAGEFEMAIQQPSGATGEPYARVTAHPRSFNTGQVLLGFCALYAFTKQPRYLEAAERAGRWLMRNVDGDGRFVRHTYAGPHSYKVRVAWALYLLADQTGATAFARCANRITDWTLAQAQETGWFAATSLTEPTKPWTHLINYTLVGLVQILHMQRSDVENDRINALLHRAAHGICREQDRRKKSAPGAFVMGQPGTYLPNWTSSDAWSCLTGNAQGAFFLMRYHELSGLPRFADTAEEIIDDLKTVHLLDGVQDPGLRGALWGSWPPQGSYCSWTVPNWGVKFFADALLLPTVPPSSAIYLG